MNLHEIKVQPDLLQEIQENWNTIYWTHTYIILSVTEEPPIIEYTRDGEYKTLTKYDARLHINRAQHNLRLR